MGFSPLLVLFVSTGNAARSLMAETLLNAKQSGAYRARSAGCDPLLTVPPDTIKLLLNEGFNVQKLHPKKWQDFYEAAHLVPVDIIVTLSEEAREELAFIDWPNAPVRVHWALDNPLGAPSPDVREWKYKKCMVTLEARIGALLRMRPDQSRTSLLLNLRAIGMVV